MIQNVFAIMWSFIHPAQAHVIRVPITARIIGAEESLGTLPITQLTGPWVQVWNRHPVAAQ